ncbi:MAG: PAS domain S-box protein [Firmicutes bacterium]|nr:PAS domain S-box protein [Bacillota bacterium]
MPEAKTSIFKSFVMNNPEAVIFCNTDGHVTMWNKGAELLFGYTGEEIKKYSIFSLVDQKYLDMFNSIFEVLKKGRGLSFETGFNSNTNEYMHLLVSAGMPEDFQTENLVYFILRDTSRERTLENKLGKYSAFIEYNPDMILEWDRNEGIVYYNSTVADFLKSKKLEPHSINSVLPEGLTARLNRIAGTDRLIEEMETKFEESIISYTFIPCSSDKDRVMISGRNITGIKKMEEEAGASFEKTEQIVNLMENLLQEFRFMDFENEIDLKTITSQALRDISDDSSSNPAYIFAGIENDERMIEGYIIEKRSGEFREVSDKLVIHPRKLKAILPEGRKPSFANWEDEAGDVSVFQRRFPEEITNCISSIENYAAYKIIGSKNGLLIAFNYSSPVNEYNSQVVKALALATGALYSIQNRFSEKEESQFAIVIKIAEVAERRDQETGEHLKRMRNYSRIIADEMSRMAKYKGLINNDYIKRIYNSAPLHDIAKVGIPDSIFQKPGKLTETEYEAMRQHTIMGGQMLEGPPFLDMARDIALYHHEKYDGSGYPFGTKGDDIPLAARIVAIADVYDAMTSKRVYKEAFSHDRTKKLISICSGGHFDPDVVEAFMTREQDFMRIKEMFRD